MSTKRECPSCRTVYAGDDKLFCPKDGTRLFEHPPARPPEDPFVGRVIAGRFVLTRCVGKGGMGVVYLANHNVLRRLFAVKLLRRENVSNERALARFFRESRVASTVDHPNLVSIYDYGQTDKGEPYLVMEYVEGTVLYELVRKSRTQNLHPTYAVHILVQVARALEHAHQRGVVHRDIKPENILLTTWNGQADWVKVLDFGVARIVGQPPLTRIGEEIIGTPEFLAPEMLATTDLLPAVDLYALGIMLHDTIVGDPPFRGDVREVLQGHLNVVPPRLSERRKDVHIPTELDQLTAQLLEKDPSRRPSAAETVFRLERIQTLMPTRAAHSPLSEAVMSAAPEPGPEASSDDKLQGTATLVLPASTVPSVENAQAGHAAKRAEVAALESEIDIASVRLSEQIERLAGEVWPLGWPIPAVELRRRIAECRQTEEQRGARLALLQEQAQQQMQRLDQRRQALRQQILSLSERLQLTEGLSESERQQIVRSIEESERSLAAVFMNAPTSPEPEMLVLRRQIRELQSEAHRGVGELARIVLKDARALPQLQASCRAIEQLQQQIEAARAMLALLTRRK